MIAWYLAEHPLPPKSKQLLIAAILIVIPTLLIARQPDLGTALLVASSGAGVLFFCRPFLAIHSGYCCRIGLVNAYHFGILCVAINVIGC